MECCINTAGTVPLDSLLRHMAVNVPEIPYSVALDQIRERYIQFARTSHLIVYFQELALQREVTNYKLVAPEGYEVYSVRGVGDPGSWVWRGPSKDYWFSAYGNRFYVKDNSEIIFDREPSAALSGQFVLLTVIPSPCCESVPTSVATPYGKGIAAGAVADALLMPNKAWTNPALAEVYEIKYNRAALSAKNIAITNRGGKTVQFAPVRIV